MKSWRRVGAVGALFALPLVAPAIDIAVPGAVAAGDPRAIPFKRRPPRTAGALRASTDRTHQVAVLQPSRSALPSPGNTERGREPRAFLIYLVDGNTPIAVTRYAREDGLIVFRRYGGLVRIPTSEVLRIVPDHHDRLANLPPPPPPSGNGRTPSNGSAELYVTMRGGSNLKVTGLAPEGSWVRVSMPGGSFTVPRSEILGVVRVPRDSEIPEAWLSIWSTDLPGKGLVGPDQPSMTPTPGLPSPHSAEPHLVRLASGQLIRVERFWVEDAQLRFHRLGGIVGISLAEVVRVIPERLPGSRGRTPVRFAQRVGPDVMEVRVRSGSHHVRLVGLDPVPGILTAEDPWRTLDRDAVVYLEFDRQRYDADGSWLAYVFLPNGRMLNAELIRLGLARPRLDGPNVRYLDLFRELAHANLASATAPGRLE